MTNLDPRMREEKAAGTTRQVNINAKNGPREARKLLKFCT